MPSPPSRLHPFLHKILGFIRKNGLIEPDDRVLAGVSGGPDSVALLHALHALRPFFPGLALTVLHFDHGLRGADSDEDRHFVEILAQQLALPFVDRREDILTWQKALGVSLEMAARERRHLFFRETLKNLGAQKIALGHSATDQAEGLLLRLLRGTGPTGAAGMSPSEPNGLIRPLLFATRQEILGFLRDEGILFRQDTSNEDPFCQRNALRLHVFPLLEKHVHPHVERTLARYAELAREEETYWEALLDELWPRVCVHETVSRLMLDATALRPMHPALLKRTLRRAAHRLRGTPLGLFAVHLETVCDLIRGETAGGELSWPDGIIVRLEGKTLFLEGAGTGEPHRTAAPSPFFIEAPGRYSLPRFGISLDLEILPVTAVTADLKASGPGTVTMDADRIRWPLEVRPWRAGDRFYPLNLGGSKKLQDLFQDARIARNRRAAVPIVSDAEKICWVIGLRLDDRVKITSSTEQVLVIRAEAAHEQGFPHSVRA